MAGTAHQTWNRHLILAEIKIRFGSLQAFAARTPLGVGHYSVALGRSYPKAESIIARALGVPAQDLWPDRYDAKGCRRRKTSSSRGSVKASQKPVPQTDMEKPA